MSGDRHFGLVSLRGDRMFTSRLIFLRYSSHCRLNTQQTQLTHHIISPKQLMYKSIGWSRQDIKGRIKLYNLPLLQNYNFVGKTQRFLNIVGNKQNGFLELALETQNFVL